MNDPALLLVDEPTSALDQHRGSEIIDLLIRMSRTQNAATILVTHDPSHLHRMDAVYEMVDGKLRALSDDEIAAAVGRPVGTVKTWLHRARAEQLDRWLARAVAATQPAGPS